LLLHGLRRQGEAIARLLIRDRALGEKRQLQSIRWGAMPKVRAKAAAAAKKAGHPWTLGKNWDTFTPMGALVPADAVPDPHALELWLRVDGEERQRGSTAHP
jgi:2-keto-4-pentenoate hydratase/2-oxohepta-3-ene-1,7-dioic acid hydratase in catechol pathway